MKSDYQSHLEQVAERHLDLGVRCNELAGMTVALACISVALPMMGQGDTITFAAITAASGMRLAYLMWKRWMIRAWLLTRGVTDIYYTPRYVLDPGYNAADELYQDVE